jgi:small-conductance mechanosensitive channel
MVLLVFRALPVFPAYRPIFSGSAALLVISAIFPRTGNALGQYLFGTVAGGALLPRELFGVAWWILGAWLCKSLFDILLRRTFFPDNDEPHARRLFADLASGLIYVLAIVGIIGTVFNQPVSTFLATSGVVAVVLGLALQNTLGDVLAGLAINIERPFGAGDWITLSEQITGQVMQINWRATRLRTWSHDMIVIPNSVISKAMVTNHTQPRGSRRCLISLKVDLSIPPERVIKALTTAAASPPNAVHGAVALAFARSFSENLVEYQLAFPIDNFALTPTLKSEMIIRIAASFRHLDIPMGTAALQVRLGETDSTTHIDRPAASPVPPVPPESEIPA